MWRGKIMPDEKKPGQSGQPSVDWKTEDTYWRNQHTNQPYADKARSYEDYAPAYRIAVEAVEKHPDKSFDEIEEELATNYHRAEPGSALPWDTARPAVRAAWDRLAGVLGPRDFDRGIRGNL
jgi:hypothetical protein